ncbi:hypothetical protein SOVF_004470 [Spinacia oleracea]|nr:hypothetical protein SOVF_004470 [Spinacia oleracea]
MKQEENLEVSRFVHLALVVVLKVIAYLHLVAMLSIATFQIDPLDSVLSPLKFVIALDATFETPQGARLKPELVEV